MRFQCLVLLGPNDPQQIAHLQAFAQKCGFTVASSVTIEQPTPPVRRVQPKEPEVEVRSLLGSLGTRPYIVNALQDIGAVTLDDLSQVRVGRLWNIARSRLPRVLAIMRERHKRFLDWDLHDAVDIDSLHLPYTVHDKLTQEGVHELGVLLRLTWSDIGNIDQFGGIPKTALQEALRRNGLHLPGR